MSHEKPTIEKLSREYLFKVNKINNSRIIPKSLKDKFLYICRNKYINTIKSYNFLYVSDLVWFVNMQKTKITLDTVPPAIIETRPGTGGMFCGVFQIHSKTIVTDNNMSYKIAMSRRREMYFLTVEIRVDDDQDGVFYTKNITTEYHKKLDSTSLMKFMTMNGTYISKIDPVYYFGQAVINTILYS